VWTRTRLAVGVISVSLALVACSGDGGRIPAGAYARRICASMQAYIDDVTTLSTDFAAQIDPATTLEEQKEGVIGFLDDVLVATDRLIVGVGRAGIPDVDGGEGIVGAIEETFTEARGVLESAKARVETIPVDDAEAFATQLDEIGTSIQSSLGGIGGSLQRLDSPELAEAVQAEPSCRAVGAVA
jgi:hypothetical protein